MGRTKKKKGHKVYALVVILLGLIIIAMTVLLLFYVQKIEVEGNEYTSSQEIVEMVETDPYAVNTLYLLIKYRFMDYEVPGSLESMSVGMKNPWTVKIKVKEKQILGYVFDNESYVYFDKEGTVVLKGRERKEGIPCIEGIDISNAVLYEPLGSGDKDLFDAILGVTREVDKYQLQPDRIVCRDGGILLYFGQVCVSLGTEITTEKMAQISPILKEIGESTGTLHLEHYQDESDAITFDKEELPEEN